MEIGNTYYAPDRASWRAWLQLNWQTEEEIWLINPHKDTGILKVPYNDAVEEALCVGWIDSTVKKLDSDHSVQRYTPRRRGSLYSRLNIERMIWLLAHDLVHPSLVSDMKKIANTDYSFPDDIMNQIKSEKDAWQHFQIFSPSYRRIRIAYIEDARSLPQEFQKRLLNFIKKTKAGIQFGYGGIEKYF